MDENILDKDLINNKHTKPFKIRPLIIWGIVLAVGILLRLMHWPGGAILILTSSAGAQAYSIVGYIKSKERNKLNIIFSILGFIWVFIIIGGIFFNDGYPFNEKGLGVYSIVFAMYFVIYYLMYFKSQNKLLN